MIDPTDSVVWIRPGRSMNARFGKSGAVICFSRLQSVYTHSHYNQLIKTNMEGVTHIHTNHIRAKLDLKPILSILNPFPLAPPPPSRPMTATANPRLQPSSASRCNRYHLTRILAPVAARVQDGLLRGDERALDLRLVDNVEEGHLFGLLLDPGRGTAARGGVLGDGVWVVALLEAQRDMAVPTITRVAGFGKVDFEGALRTGTCG